MLARSQESACYCGSIRPPAGNRATRRSRECSEKMLEGRKTLRPRYTSR